MGETQSQKVLLSQSTHFILPFNTVFYIPWLNCIIKRVEWPLVSLLHVSLFCNYQHIRIVTYYECFRKCIYFTFFSLALCGRQALCQVYAYFPKLRYFKKEMLIEQFANAILYFVNMALVLSPLHWFVKQPLLVSQEYSLNYRIVQKTTIVFLLLFCYNIVRDKWMVD